MPLPAIIAGGALATRLFGGRAIARAALPVAAGVGIGDLLGGGGARAGRRRRRRRALTASDRADIAYIAATISKAEAGRFASQLIAGLTR